MGALEKVGSQLETLGIENWTKLQNRTLERKNLTRQP